MLAPSWLLCVGEGEYAHSWRFWHLWCLMYQVQSPAWTFSCLLEAGWVTCVHCSNTCLWVMRAPGVWCCPHGGRAMSPGHLPGVWPEPPLPSSCSLPGRFLKKTFFKNITTKYLTFSYHQTLFSSEGITGPVFRDISAKWCLEGIWDNTWPTSEAGWMEQWCSLGTFPDTNTKADILFLSLCAVSSDMF